MNEKEKEKRPFFKFSGKKNIFQSKKLSNKEGKFEKERVKDFPVKYLPTTNLGFLPHDLELKPNSTVETVSSRTQGKNTNKEKTNFSSEPQNNLHKTAFNEKDLRKPRMDEAVDRFDDISKQESRLSSQRKKRKEVDMFMFIKPKEAKAGTSDKQHFKWPTKKLIALNENKEMFGSKETGKKDFGDLDNDGYVSDELQQSSNKIAQLEEFDYKVSDEIAKPASDLQKAKTSKIELVDQNQNTETGRKNTKNDKLSLYDDEYSIAINSQNLIKDIKNEEASEKRFSVLAYLNIFTTNKKNHKDNCSSQTPRRKLAHQHRPRYCTQLAINKQTSLWTEPNHNKYGSVQELRSTFGHPLKSCKTCLYLVYLVGLSLVRLSFV